MNTSFGLPFIPPSPRPQTQTRIDEWKLVIGNDEPLLLTEVDFYFYRLLKLFSRAFYSNKETLVIDALIELEQCDLCPTKDVDVAALVNISVAEAQRILQKLSTRKAVMGSQVGATSTQNRSYGFVSTYWSLEPVEFLLNVEKELLWLRDKLIKTEEDKSWDKKEYVCSKFSICPNAAQRRILYGYDLEMAKEKWLKEHNGQMPPLGKKDIEDAKAAVVWAKIAADKAAAKLLVAAAKVGTAAQPVPPAPIIASIPHQHQHQHQHQHHVVYFCLPSPPGCGSLVHLVTSGARHDATAFTQYFNDRYNNPLQKEIRALRTAILTAAHSATAAAEGRKGSEQQRSILFQSTARAANTASPGYVVKFARLKREEDQRQEKAKQQSDLDTVDVDKRSGSKNKKQKKDSKDSKDSIESQALRQMDLESKNTSKKKPQKITAKTAKKDDESTGLSVMDKFLLESAKGDDAFRTVLTNALSHNKSRRGSKKPRVSKATATAPPVAVKTELPEIDYEDARFPITTVASVKPETNVERAARRTREMQARFKARLAAMDKSE